VSFGMLLLVGVSGVMLVFSTRRARRLAQQQMEFVAGVTHELRTPLSVISSASQNLADGVTTGADQVKRYGTVIRDQATRLAGMVEQVLRFAGMSSDRYEMQWQTLEIGPVIEQALQDCAPEFQRTGTLVDRHIAPGLPKLEGDPAALGQCLRNLLENAAIHGATRNGAHALDPAHVTIGAKQNGGSIEIRVEDNGPGIDSSALPHLFEPFYRGRRAIEDQIHGTGLGLSLVKHIMDAHGGAVEVRSSAMEGTCFTLKLPVRTD
jgi:signal transduction histidine kinase